MAKPKAFKKFIATTTINHPTAAYNEYAAKSDWHLVIAGDYETPGRAYSKFVKSAAHKNVTYLSPYRQSKLYSTYSDMVGFNTISRRVFAILYAYQQGADVIALVDDDNIPLPGWGESLLVGELLKLRAWQNTKSGVVDPIYVGLGKVAANRPEIWHRGFPFEALGSRNASAESGFKRKKIHVQADMWAGDPDIDAISRLYLKSVGAACDLPWDETRFPFTVKGFAPFNSQNTFISREIVPHYVALPSLKRMEDIWLAYYIEMLGYNVAFNKPSVTQVRNLHGFFKDFSDELLGYQRTAHLLSILRNGVQSQDVVKAKYDFLQLIPRHNGHTAAQLSAVHRKVVNKINSLKRGVLK